RLHYNVDNPDAPNNASSITKRLRSQLIHPNELNDNVQHSVEVRYFDKSPPWLEVIIDNDLFLQKRDIDVERIIGGRNAFVGFTASTGQFPKTASTITINGVEISSIAIEDKNVKALNLPIVEPQVALANGRQTVAFLLKTFDFCTNPIEFGGSGNRAK